MARQPEGKLVKQMRELIIRRGGRPFKIHGDEEGFQEIGIPDLLVCYRGYFVGIEVKMPGGKLRPVQRVVLHEIYAADGVAAVCETVEQVSTLLSILEGRRPSEKAMCFDRGSVSNKFSIK